MEDTNAIRDELTKKDLEKLENNNKKTSFFKLLIPLIVAFLAIGEYLLSNAYPSVSATNLYPKFLGFLIAIYLIELILSFKIERLRDRLSYKWPLFTAVFVIFIIFDVLTLKKLS